MADAGPKLLRGLLEVFILESLEQSPKHGYALLKEMTETFGQEPNRNRLYPLLGRLVRDGYVREVNESGGNRTLYALTDAGRDALHAYRRLPGAFRHALRRIWSVDVHPQNKAPATATGAATPEADTAGRILPVLDGDADDDADDDTDEDVDDGIANELAETTLAAPRPARRAGMPAPAAVAGDAPYPCVDARVDMQKDARTGDLTLRLTGCPMGAYDYCPQCPIHQAVRGMRRLMFPD